LVYIAFTCKFFKEKKNGVEQNMVLTVFWLKPEKMQRRGWQPTNQMHLQQIHPSSHLLIPIILGEARCLVLVSVTLDALGLNKR